MKKTVAAIALLLAVSPAQAQFFTGNQLHEWCQQDMNTVTAYAVGMFDAAFLYERLRGVKDRICVPEGLVTDQVGEVACKYVAEHPESRHLVAVESVLESFAEAWPCQK